MAIASSDTQSYRYAETMSGPTSTTRLLFLDNIRYLMVALVLLFHVSAGYSGLPESYQEANSGGLIRALRNFLAPLPRLPIPFFVSGYFAALGQISDEKE